MLLYTLMAVDGNGASQVAELCHMLKIFKEKNPKWTDTKVIITDKDIQRAISKNELPQVKLQLCLYHTMRTFHGEQCDASKQLLQRLAHAQTEELYMELYESFIQTVPRSVKGYLTPIGMSGSHNFLCNTTNCVESFFSKVKSCVSPRSSLKAMISGVMCCLSKLLEERHFKTAQTFNCVQISHRLPSESRYKDLLTPFAYKEIQKQLPLRYSLSIDTDGCVEATCGKRSTKTTQYDCSYNRCMLLPCKHMLAFVDLFSVKV